MKHLSWTLLLIAATLAACSSDDDTEPQNPATTPAVAQPELRPMYVDVTENPLTDEAEARQETTTRTAEATTTATLSAFTMNYTGDYSYLYEKDNDGKWTDTHTWPIKDNDDQKIDFYAYTCDYEKFNYNNGNPYLSYTVAEDAFNQHDLLVAEHKQISYNQAKDSERKAHVSLHFQHACAVVQLNVQITNKLTGAEYLNSQTLTVNSIVLRNVNNTGHYNYATRTWSGVSGSAYYTLTNGNLGVTTVSQQLPCGLLFMIPQTREANGTTGTYLEVNYTTSTAKTAYIPLTVNWEAGCKYTINIKLGTTTIAK